MSRTDKTAPYWVKVHYYPEWLQEYHDHTEGPCTLPPRPTKPTTDESVVRLHYGGRRLGEAPICYWYAGYSTFWCHPMSHCPCPMCHGYYWDFSNPKHPRRQRRAGRRYCQGGWQDEY